MKRESLKGYCRKICNILDSLGFQHADGENGVVIVVRYCRQNDEKISLSRARAQNRIASECSNRGVQLALNSRLS